jgi:putative DNA primase/helicase
LTSGDVAKVEILAKGQQFVAYGIHPGTQRNYRWGDARPDNTPLAALPMVTREALKNFIDLAEQLILLAGGKGSKSTDPKSENPGRSDKKPPEWSEVEARRIREAPNWSDVEAGRIREALKHIPADDRKVWLDVGMALHSTGWGEPARMLWNEWSRTAPKKFDEKDQHRTWESFRSERNDG